MYWEIECRLLGQPIVYPGKRLLANLTGSSKSQNTGFEPVVVRILPSTVQTLHGSHDNCSHHCFVLQRQADTASVRHFEGLEDLLVRIELPDDQCIKQL